MWVPFTINLVKHESCVLFGVDVVLLRKKDYRLRGVLHYSQTIQNILGDGK